MPSILAAIFCMVRGATVEAMPTIMPGRAAAAIPSAPSTTASASASKPTTTMTKSLSAATALGVATTLMPAPSACCRAAALTSQAATVEAALAQMPRHRQSHLAETDDPDAANVGGHCALLSLICGASCHGGRAVWQRRTGMIDLPQCGARMATESGAAGSIVRAVTRSRS